MPFVYRPVWSVLAGGVGYSTFALANNAIATPVELGTAAAAIRTFFESVKQQLASGVTITYPTEVLDVDDATGELQDVVTISPPGGTGATGTLPFAAGVGSKVTWATSGVREGRRVRGMTYLVPAPTALYDNQGTLDETRRLEIQSAGGSLVTALAALPCELVVWSRPREASEGVSARAGATFAVVGASCRDKVAVLRTRRD